MPKAQTASRAEIQILLENEKVRCKIKGERDQLISCLADLLLDTNPDPNCFRSLIENAMSFAALKRMNELHEEQILKNYKRPKNALSN